MLRSLSLAIAALLLSLAAPAQADDAPRTGPAAAWVVPFPAAAAKRTPAPPSDAPVELLRLDQQLRFGAERDENYFESAVRIRTAAGLAAMGTIAIPWNPAAATLTFHKLRILRGAEVIDVLASGQKFTVLRREGKLEAATLDGVLTATMQLEGLQVGDIVEIAFTAAQRDPTLSAHSEFFVLVPPDLQDARMRIAASWDAGRPIRWRASPVTPAPRVWRDKGVEHLELIVERLPRLTAPKFAPNRFQPLRYVEFTDYRSWGELAAAIAPLYATAATFPAGSPLAAEVARIRAASPDPKTRASAALQLVQERVRYVYQGMNAGNLRPALATETWDRRFGDCKAKTALLLAILRALDIAAEPAMVSTNAGDGLDAHLPIAQAFDHILVRADIGGRAYWLDGTRRGDRTVDAVAPPPFRWALPATTAQSILVALVPEPFATPQTVTTIAIDASKGIDAVAPVTVTTAIGGDEAVQLREQFAALSAADRDKALRDYWKGEYDFMTPTTVAGSFDPATGIQTLSLVGTAKLGWNADGYELDGASLGWDNDYAREAGPDADAPVAINFPNYRKFVETIKLPNGGKGFSVQGGDVDRTIAGHAFSRRTRIDGDTLRMEASTRALAPEIPYRDAVATAAELKAMRRVRLWVRAPAAQEAKAAAAAIAQGDTPTDAKGFFDRGYRYYRQGMNAEAIADFTRAVALDGDYAPALAARGMVRATQGEIDPALDDLDAAAALNPRIEDIHLGRALVLENSGDLGGAIAALTRALAIDPEDNWALSKRAYLHFARGDSGKALADLDTLDNVGDGGSEALVLRARILAAGADRGAAIALLDARLATTPDPDSVALARAKLLVLDGKTELARGAFATVRARVGDQALRANELCWAQAEADFDLALARADCDLALKLAPNDLGIVDSAGLVALRQGRFGDAITTYDTVLKGAPTLASSLYGRGLARIRNGDKAAGEADIAAARERSATVTFDYADIGLKP